MAYVEVGAALTARPREAAALALKAASAAAPAPAYASLDQASVEKMKTPGALARIVSWVLDDPRWAFSLLRRVWPTPVIKGWGLITRYDDVVEALKQDRAIATPFGPKIEALNGGPNFLLGMADGDDYRRLQGHVRAAFPPEDNAAVIAPLAAAEARAIIEASPGRLDAIRDLITRVPTEICEKHYGVKVPDEIRFGEWTIAMSSYMFGDPTNNPTVREAAIEAGVAVRAIVDAAIAAARADPSDADTVVKRLLAAQQTAQDELSDAVIRSILIGMITGFVPTNTMAAGNTLEMLLRRPDFMAHAREAARSGDDARLKRCLFEAFRFKPLNPGPFRVAAEDYVVAPGTRRAKRIRKGTQLMVCTQSAMFDPRRVVRPNRFDPDRPFSNYMMFGHGLHWCIGAPLAEAQITQTMKPLLLKRNLRRAPGQAGKLRKRGPFPAHLVVEWDPD